MTISQYCRRCKVNLIGLSKSTGRTFGELDLIYNSDIMLFDTILHMHSKGYILFKDGLYKHKIPRLRLISFLIRGTVGNIIVDKHRYVNYKDLKKILSSAPHAS